MPMSSSVPIVTIRLGLLAVVCNAIMAIRGCSANPPPRDPTVELLEKIFVTDRYDRRIRPFDDGDETRIAVVVDIDLLMTDLIELVSPSLSLYHGKFSSTHPPISEGEQPTRLVCYLLRPEVDRPTPEVGSGSLWWLPPPRHPPVIGVDTETVRLQQRGH